jgi:Fe-S-cluster containining protein
MKHRLPLFVERVVAETLALQVQTGQNHEQKLRREGGFTCKVGCSNCCHHPFLITVVEGLLLYQHLSAHGRWSPSFKKRVRETRDKTLGLSFEVWLLSNIACPLLNDKNECSAYESRPVHCRTTFSNGDPRYCHPHELGELTRMLPNTESVVNFNNFVQARLHRIGVPGPLMPLSEAVLLGEAIVTGELAIEESAIQHIKDFL